MKNLIILSLLFFVAGASYADYPYNESLIAGPGNKIVLKFENDLQLTTWRDGLIVASFPSAEAVKAEAESCTISNVGNSSVDEAETAHPGYIILGWLGLNRSRGPTIPASTVIESSELWIYQKISGFPGSRFRMNVVLANEKNGLPVDSMNCLLNSFPTVESLQKLLGNAVEIQIR